MSVDRLMDRALDLPSIVFAVLVMALAWAVIGLALVTVLAFGEVLVSL